MLAAADTFTPLDRGPFTGTVVAPGTITIVVPEITVVLPCRGIFGLTGSVVGPFIMSSVVPLITVSCPRDIRVETGMVVGPGITRKGNPDM